jgi:acyl carrier protein
MPLTAHGKVDRRALPMPTHPKHQRDNHSVAPQTSAEKIVAKIWSGLLNIEEEAIGVNDNFFELGGHSLLTTQLRSRLSEVFMIEIPLRDFFEVPTISEMVGLIAQMLGGRELTEEIAQTQVEIQQLSEEYLKILPPEQSTDVND